ncbi:hypothetical protein GOODEAATRI_022043, partial [Goodea atripinnis]
SSQRSSERIDGSHAPRGSLCNLAGRQSYKRRDVPWVAALNFHQSDDDSNIEGSYCRSQRDQPRKEGPRRRRHGGPSLQYRPRSSHQAADAFPRYAAEEEAAALSSAPRNPYEEPRRMLEAHEAELQLPIFTIQEAEIECTSKPTRDEEQGTDRRQEEFWVRLSTARKYKWNNLKNDF